MDDDFRLRVRQDGSDDEATRFPGGDDEGSPCVLGKTVAVGTYPATASAYYWITPQVVLGAEVEGGSGTVAASGGGRFLALNLGTAIPPAGSAVICTFVRFRYVFRWD